MGKAVFIYPLRDEAVYEALAVPAGNLEYRATVPHGRDIAFYALEQLWYRLAEIRQPLLRVPGTGYQVSGMVGRLTL